MDDAQNTTAGIRLQKFLAERGIASRRKCAEIIQEGRVTINGALTTEPGFRINPSDDVICLDGTKLNSSREHRRTILLYKPRGYICSASSKDGRTVYELIKDIPERLVPVGRLDRASEGLLLMSNDGDLILRLTHPRYEHEKTYEVTVSGKVDERVLDVLRSRMIIDGYKIQPVKVAILRENKFVGREVLRFILKEGRNRQIRNMCEQVGLTVHQLVRTRIGTLSLTGLKPGEWRECKEVPPCFQWNTSFKNASSRSGEE